MFKFNTVSLCLSLVLSFGLMSCSKSEKETKRDTYRAPAPRLIKSGQSIDLNGWDRSSQRTLDIQDELDVRNSGSIKVEIDTTCRHAQTDIQYTLETTEKNTIPVFQFLPGELLVADLAAEDTVCAFKIVLTNENKSKHIYTIHNALIRNTRPALIGLEQNSERLDQSLHRFNQSELSNVNFRSPVSGASAEITCKDVVSPRITIRHLTGLMEFDLYKMLPRHGREADVLANNPIQLCRIAIYTDKVLEAFTPFFELRFNRAPLTLRVESQQHRTESEVWIPVPPVPALEGQPLQVAAYVIENPSAVPRLVRISKQPLNVQVIVMQTERPRTIRTAALRYIHLESTGGIVEDSESVQKLSVPANGQLNLNVIFKAREALGCPTTYPNLTLDFLEPLVVEEVGDSNEVLGRLTAELGPRVYLNMKAALIAGPAINAGAICSWN